MERDADQSTGLPRITDARLQYDELSVGWEDLVDAGTITSLLTIEEQVNIDYVLVTHAHLDHVRDIMFLQTIFVICRKVIP